MKYFHYMEEGTVQKTEIVRQIEGAVFRRKISVLLLAECEKLQKRWYAFHQEMLTKM